MVRGHIDDLILITEHGVYEEDGMAVKDEKQHLILYDYKTQNSRAFTYQKGKPMSYYHKMQLGTYMYMLRSYKKGGDEPNILWNIKGLSGLTEARILKISKDDLRMDENELLWSLDLEVEIRTYWMDLRKAWLDYQETGKLPDCTCADHEGGFLAKEAYNPYFFEGEPCSLQYYQDWKAENAVK
jgi:hypothetical protein